MKKIILSIFITTIISCSPKIVTKIAQTIPPLDYKEEVIIIGPQDLVPYTVLNIGTLKTRTTTSTKDCEWDVVMEKAKIEAREAGANIIKIMTHYPTPGSKGGSCDAITARIMKIKSIEVLHKLSSLNETVIDSTWDYAKLHVYRAAGAGFLIGYNLHLGDSVLCRVKHNSFQEIKIRKKGMNTLWAGTEAKIEIPINVEFGKEYYLKSGIKPGIIVGRPTLELVSTQQGKISIQYLKSRNNKRRK